MRVVVVTDRVVDDQAPGQVAYEVRAGWSSRAPHDTVECALLGDGGPGLVDVVCHAAGDVCTVPVVVSGPSGEQVPAQIAMIERDGTRTAYLDAAHAAGRHLVAPERLSDPTGLTSAGVGELLDAARAQGARRVVLGLGELACHDGGAGALGALGAGADLRHLARVAQDWAGVRVVLAAAGDLPLTGFHGSSAALGTEHAVAAVVTQRLERAMGEWSQRVDGVLVPPTDLLTGRRQRPERAVGAGLGGGVGYALQRLGARTVPGAELLLEESGLRDRLAGALVVLVTDVYDWRRVAGGVLAATAEAARDAASPTVVLAREIAVGRREGMSLGISGSYARRADESWRELAARVARTWSPPGQW